VASTRFGQLLREHRRAAGLTQEVLAEKAGLSVHGIQKLERGITHPYPDTLQRLLRTFTLAPEDRQEFEAAARRPPQYTATGGRSSIAPRHNLPAQPTSFVGRQRELAELTELLARAECRLVTLTGPGGIGKTRLAIEVARQQLSAFADGVFFVPLGPIESPGMLAQAVAGALSLSLTGAESAINQLCRYLQDQHVLLVLDNFEHLLKASDVIVDLLGAPGVKLIATSRERLNLQEEWVFDVTGLPFPEGPRTAPPGDYAAVELFIQRAQQVQTSFSLADNTEAVVEICQRLEGMPLALELAATWLRIMPCREIGSRIERSLDFLATSVRNAPKRHRSIRVVLDHSWSLLTDRERKVLARLSVFRGGFDLEAAAAVAGASLPRVVSLVDKSLVRLTVSGRYDLHELLRQYLTDKLDQAGETAEVKRRHLDFYCDLAKSAEAHQYGAEQEAWFDRLEAEHDNLGTALAWALNDAQIEQGLVLAGALGFFWELRSHWYEGNQWLPALLERAQGTTAHARAKAMRFAAMCAAYRQDEAQARVCAEEGLALARESGDSDSIAWLLSAFGLYVEGGNPERAVALQDEALTLFRATGDKFGISHALRRLGIALITNGDYERARLVVEEALVCAREAGDQNALAWSLLLLGNAVWLQTGDVANAAALYEEALSLSERLRDWGLYLWVLLGLAAAAREQGEYAQAQSRYEEIVALVRDRHPDISRSWPDFLAGAVAALGGLAVARGRPELAARLFGAAGEFSHPWLKMLSRIDRQRDMAVARAQLGTAAYEAAFIEGQTMAMDHVIALALRRDVRGGSGARQPKGRAGANV
jgi:predicted ATPase/DNA-binding XRE family transcriptional regulator